ncbi:Putative membrane protein [Streptomyces venezuelae]|uniref:hypothetical protein n=1 Tax=Streptomyces gardneri TaxID=66892 RepID=UPI0006BC383E|nr:hypothetical protein [Streptomyces gardneri]ALO11234.1 Putative membrane protein [Streptomyces venezuelae]QPK48160.1 hypothetical protein H4W23_28300 [Streptomyces gardneri]WRK39620.1 hypothetical protein U0M97_28435 [Streptomyces venezuelae]CUM38251.1 putative membrane protein [Streptomyces venezuelae]
MRTRPLSALSALAGLILLLLLALAPSVGARASEISDAAAALKQGPVYVDPGAAAQLSQADADALAQKIKDADKPLFMAVLPANAEFPPEDLFQNLRTQTGITGLYAIRLGDGFDAKADSSVMSQQAVQNLVTSVRQPGVDAATELNNFADQALPTLRGSAPASWGTAGADSGVPVAGLVTLGAVVAVSGGAAYAVVRRKRLRKEAEERDALDKLRVVVDEDITAFGEELERLDFHPAEPGADDAKRGDYERALDSYDKAKSLMASAAHPHDVRGVTQALDDGRFSLALLAARRESRPLPERRAPCFFDPRHGLSTEDRTWTPAGSAARQVPVCAADAARLDDGLDPLARTVDTDAGRRPYWEAGPAYGPWAGGYFGGGLLPGLLVGTMLGSALSTPAYASEYGGGEFQGGDFSGAEFSGSDFGGGDFGGGGGFGGGDFGGGGGFDGGGGF